MTTALLIAGGLVLLVAGGDALVRGGVAVARRFGVSPLLIGLTLVGFGTSTPELVTSLHAAFAGSPGIAVGNVVGSNTCNILLILGLGALIRPLATDPRAFRRDGLVVVLASLACVAAALWGTLERGTGAILLAALLGYLGFTYRHERIAPDAAAPVYEAESHEADPVPVRLWVGIALAVGGLGLTIAGARLLVDGAITLARDVGMSETVIGLTIVAVGTSLPELVATVVAAARGQSDIAFGNVVGSSIYNILGILGTTALVHPIPVPAEIAAFDVWVMAGATAFLILFAVTGWRVNRVEGAAFVGAYGAYTAWLVWG